MFNKARLAFAKQETTWIAVLYARYPFQNFIITELQFNLYNLLNFKH